MVDLKNKSLIQIHSAVLLFGLAGVFGKLVLLPSIIIVFGRVLFASVFLFFMLKHLNVDMRLEKKKDYAYLFLLGLILAVHWSTFFQAIKVSSVGVGLLTFSTFPVFVTFLEPLIFKENIRVSDMLAALVTFAGIVLIVPKFQLSNSITRGALWGITSGFTFAVLSILNRKYVKKYSSLVIAFYQDLSAAILLFPFLFILKPAFSMRDILLLLVLGVVFTGISHSLFIGSLSGIKTQTASIIACLEPVYGIIFSIFLLGETPDARTVLGGIIILGTVFYSTLRQQNDKKK